MNTLRRRILLLGSAIFFTAVIAVYLSRRTAFATADDTMRPWQGVSEYAYTRFRLLGYIDGSGPTWLFYYDSPEAFGAAPFTVEVNVLGRLRTVHVTKSGLWDQAARRWAVVPGGNKSGPQMPEGEPRLKE